MKKLIYATIITIFLSSCSKKTENNIYEQEKEIFANRISSIVLLKEDQPILIMKGQCEAVGGYKTRWCSLEEVSLVSFTYGISISPRTKKSGPCLSKFVQVNGATEGAPFIYGEGCYSLGQDNYYLPKKETDRMRKMVSTISNTVATTPLIPN